MVVIERMPGLGVRIGAYTLKVLAVHAGEVVVALIDPDKDCFACGERPAKRRRCPGCSREVVVCPACARSRQCSGCSSFLE